MSVLAASEQPASTVPLMLAALGDRANGRLRGLLTTYMLAGAAGRLARQWWGRARTEMTYTVAVAGDDSIYPDVHGWLLDRVPSRRRKAVTAKTSSANTISVPGDEGSRAGLQLFYDGSRAQTVDLDGHRVAVQVERPEWANWRPGDDDLRRGAALERVIFTCHSPEGRDAVLAFLAEVAANRSRREPRLYVATQWGDWARRNDVGRRPLATVVLRGGRQEALVDDLATFLAREGDYGRLGIPWHRGYLFHGPPGTGKTSAAKALAAHFRLDVHYIALPAVKDDTALIGLLNNVDPRCMLLLEDIDVVHASRVRDDDRPGVSLSGLLNVLDGFVTPHGLITVMTTNDRDVLDQALIRPGRVDRDEPFALLDDEQLGRLVHAFLGHPVDLPPLRAPLPPAAVVDAVKSHLDDPEAAAVAIKELLR